jgi:hypothetical protein
MITAFCFFLVGVAGRVLIARFYYSQPAKHLKREAGDLRRHSILLLQAMNRAGWV